VGTSSVSSLCLEEVLTVPELIILPSAETVEESELEVELEPEFELELAPEFEPESVELEESVLEPPEFAELD